jgi:hypothetical protein
VSGIKKRCEKRLSFLGETYFPPEKVSFFAFFASYSFKVNAPPRIPMFQDFPETSLGNRGTM